MDCRTAVGGRRFQLHAVSLEDLAEFTEVFDNQIRFGIAELVEILIPGEDCAGGDATVVSGFDVVLHVADEQCFVGCEIVLLQDLMNALSFVADVEVAAFEELPEAGAGLLDFEMVGMDGAEDEGAGALFPAEEKEVARVGQWEDAILDFTKPIVEPGFELIHWDMRDVTIVKGFERERKFGAELVQCELGYAGALQGMVAGFPDGREIIDQGT